MAGPNTVCMINLLGSDTAAPLPLTASCVGRWTDGPSRCSSTPARWCGGIGCVLCRWVQRVPCDVSECPLLQDAQAYNFIQAFIPCRKERPSDSIIPHDERHRM